MFRSHILVCGGTGCTSSGSARIVTAFEKELATAGLDKEVKVIKTGCFGLCALGPIVVVYPEGAFYSQVKPEDIPEIVEEHLLKGRIVKRLLYSETVQEDTIKSLGETDFYKKQLGSGWPSKTAASSTRRTSTNTSPTTATWPWGRSLPK